MSMENFKTILLLNLVVISIFLTYNLWTYQPDSSMVQNEKYIQDVPSVTKKDLSAIIFPSQMIVHKGLEHYASEQILRINPVYKILEQGEFDDFKDVSYKIPKSQFLSFVHAKNRVEFVFPAEIPFEVFKNLFSIQEKDMEPQTFDRLLINLYPNENSKDEVQAFFVSYESRKIYSATLKGIAVKDLVNTSNEFAGQADEYFMYAINETRAIFLPEDNVNMKQMFYVTSDLDEEMFQNILFTDPRYVKQDKTSSWEMYTDGTRLLRIFNTTQMLEYENSSVSQKEVLTGAPLVQQSIDFINNHGGWTDSYRLYNVIPGKGETVFRLHADNSFPVFNTDGMSSLKLGWGLNEIRSFKRPLFWLFVKKEEDTTVELPSGRTILSFIQQNAKDSMKEIKNIAVGYELEPDVGLNGEKVIGVKLNPIWYISYGDSYKKIEWDAEKGGELVGLE
ncbi:two-component system activity regulator YycH [Ectobacillus funiculus]|uniref:YycH family regulatory protein n=1 Tax=Ectobacillus funiculus TaxID=137993 RepID=UPI00397A57C4